MSSIKFDATVLEPVSNAAPGRKPLLRRASALELAKLDRIHEQAPEAYEVGNILRLQLMDNQVQATITKTFTPFTMAQAMVVRIFEPTLNLEGDFVLKLYDRRYSTEIRTLRGVTNDWSIVKDMALEKRRWNKDFVKFFLHLMANGDLHYAGEDFDENNEDNNHSEIDDDDDESESNAYEEMFYQVQCLKMYRAELEVYRRARAHGIDGKHVPRFISSVRVPSIYTSKYHQTECSSIKGTPGVLLQYLSGFPMTDLHDTSCPRASRRYWKSVIDDGLQTVQYFMQHMQIRNLDQSTPRNTVVHWDPIDGKWKCKLIDFGHCDFRPHGMRKWDWRSWQAAIDEESAMARPMETCLRERKGFSYQWKRSQYSEELFHDFRGELSTGVEPDDYEA